MKEKEIIYHHLHHKNHIKKGNYIIKKKQIRKNFLKKHFFLKNKLIRKRKIKQRKSQKRFQHRITCTGRNSWQVAANGQLRTQNGHIPFRGIFANNFKKQGHSSAAI